MTVVVRCRFYCIVKEEAAGTQGLRMKGIVTGVRMTLPFTVCEKAAVQNCLPHAVMLTFIDNAFLKTHTQICIASCTV